MAPKIYRHLGPQPVVNIPQMDLQTLLFDSEHSVLAIGTDDIDLHIECTNPTNKLTKSSLLNYIQRIAHGLRSKYSIGATGHSKDVVTVISHGQILVPAVFHAVIAAGGIYSAASPHSTVSELSRTITIGTSKLLVCGTEFIDVATKAARECNLPLSRVLVLDSSPNAWSLKSLAENISCISSSLLPMPRITDPQQLKDSCIVILWSSGTTGLPKGVSLSHLNLVAETYLTALSGREWAVKQVEMGKELAPYRTLAHLPISHIAGLFGYLIGPLYSGGCVYWMQRYKWDELLKYARLFRPTAFYTVPSIFLRIAKSAEVGDAFKSVEGAVTGAAPMDGGLMKASNAKLRNEGEVEGKEGTYVGQTWGLSETTGAVTAQPRGEERDETGSIGRILPNVEIRMVDEGLRDVERGEEGEMLVRSCLVTNGYFNNRKATDEAFVEIDGDKGGKWFCTGDIGVLRENGKFYVVDRKKELLKYKGLQVAPAEIENLLFSHPRIAEAAVVGVPGSGSEEGSDLPRAYVVRRGDVGEEEIKEFVKKELAHYKQLRGGVVFVDEIPKNAIGKFLRRELRERAKKEVKTERARL